METRSRLTPFARFFLFLVLILPLAYLGAAYYNGEDPIANVKELVTGTQKEAVKRSTSTYDPQAEIKDLKKENRTLREKIKGLEKTISESKQKWGQ